MRKEPGKKRFGITAISKGYITLEQFAKAVKIQTGEDLSEADHRLIGEILVDLGFMSESQVNDVLASLLKHAYMFECPKCGIMINNCPSCSADLRKA